MAYLTGDMHSVTEAWSTHEEVKLTGDGTLSRKANSDSPAVVGVRSATEAEGSAAALVLCGWLELNFFEQQITL